MNPTRWCLSPAHLLTGRIASNAALAGQEDDFFAAASEDEEASASSIYPSSTSGGPDVDEAPVGKRKRDKKLPDRNRKKKKPKPEA